MTPEFERAIHNFREYLKIKSVHPQPDYESCIHLLKKMASELELKTQVLNLDERNPMIIISLEGEEPNLPSILLNSHMDVVPVYEDQWNHDPFGAYMDDKGDIYARGAQDMKCVTIAQLEAIRRLKQKGEKMKRTVHITVLPDEEKSSAFGMAKFVKTATFKKLNIGFDLDEGVPSPTNELIIFKNEKSAWRFTIHCPGNAGHGSLLLPNTAGEKLRIVLDKFMEFRQNEKDKISDGSDHLQEGHVTSVNLTKLEGGVQNNVVPPKFEAGFDMRVDCERNHEELEKWIHFFVTVYGAETETELTWRGKQALRGLDSSQLDWSTVMAVFHAILVPPPSPSLRLKTVKNDVCKSAGEGVYAEFHQKDRPAATTALQSNSFITTLESTLKKMHLDYRMTICTGATDGRFSREAGVPTLGLSPFLNTKWAFHDHNEHMNAKEFLKGVSRYESIIEALANV